LYFRSRRRSYAIIAFSIRFIVGCFVLLKIA
jgi:hypothetical protein